MHLQCSSTHTLREGHGHAHINVTTFTQFGQNWSIGCLFALCGSAMRLAQLCGGFWTIFFLLSVLAHLKKYINNINENRLKLEI